MCRWGLKGLRTEVLSVSPLVALHVQQGVAVVDEASAVGTVGHLLTLAVSGDEEAVGRRDRSWRTGNSLWTV
ncbi:hypothetical protein VZT92_017341 [Zoarces viviparus]|uniref:Uncharacterized protein n=1 Tax=Zoarces viviparus TaxID=48416 RepID=A0AAW1ERX1_ZOAVI